MRAARSIFVLGERAAHGEIDLECSEKICGDGATNHTDWLAFARNDSTHRQSRGEIRKNALLRTPIQKIWERNGFVWRFPGNLGDREKLRRMRKRSRFQKHAINEAENRGVCADPKRERDDGDKGESGRFAELTQCEFEIMHLIPRVAPGSDQRVRHAAPGRDKQATPPKPEQLPL